jgi:hypothetical protein
MADEAVAVTEVTDATPEAQTATAADNSGQGATGERTFTQADVDRIIADRLTQANKQAESRAAKAKADAEKAALAEQGKWEEIAKQAQAELAEAQRQATEAQAALMRREVAAKHNLPAALIDRLRGETIEELEDDAKALLAALPKPTAPNINGAAGTTRTTGQFPPGMTEETLRDQAVRIGVNPETYIAQFRR